MNNIAIGLDVMGGDNAPRVTLQAAYKAALKGIRLVLFGPKPLIEQLLEDHNKEWSSLPLSIIDAPESVAMDDDPIKAIHNKKNSSLVIGLKALGSNTIQALVSAGNSGAVLAGSIVYVGRMNAVRRPALVSFIPSSGAHQALLIDLGVNTDLTALHLVEFACMGAAFVQLKRKIIKPRVALLANGTERSKGSAVVKQAHALLKDYVTESFEFIGNCEPADVFAGRVDIVVTDGFCGNIFIKSAEATLDQLTRFIKKELNAHWWNRGIGLLIRPLLRKMSLSLNVPGGALLLGIEQPVIIAHGAAQAHDICNALEYAYQLACDKIITNFGNSMKQHLLKDRVVKKID